ncbi:GmrSD restriction endonuclease domain-containing protein [Spirillospora sp. CA-108201]
MRRSALVCTLAVVLPVSAGFLVAPAAAHTPRPDREARQRLVPPPPPDAAAARTHLGELVVAPEGSMDGYSREKFPHWATVQGTCDTRETVLKRDGQNVETNSACQATSGRWESPYDGGVWTDRQDLDIDHMVPLAQAWRSGADEWTTARRRQFANDLESSQLWAVTDNVNQAKGDKDPARWKPPLTSFYCTYARSWVDVKWRYKLNTDAAEKSALTDMLTTC